MDGLLAPASEHTIAEQSKNSRYSTTHHIVIAADTRIGFAVGRPLPGNRNGDETWKESRVKHAVGRTKVC
jgi:hypothetical protein